MPKALDLQHRYKVFLEEEFVYTFTTKNFVKYKILFDDISSEGVENMYSLSFFPTNANEKKYDEEVAKTIIAVFKHFFENHKNSVFYLCDISDNREIARYRLFNQWFHSDKFRDSLVKMDNLIEAEEQVFYTSIIYHKENPNAEKIKTFIKNNIDTLNKIR